MRFNPLHKDRNDETVDDRMRPGDDGGRDDTFQDDGTRRDGGRVEGVRDDGGRDDGVRDQGLRDEGVRDDPARTERPVATEVGTEKRRIAPRAPQLGSALSGFLAAVGSYVVIAAVVHAVVEKADTGHGIAAALDGARAHQPGAVSWSGAIALLVLAFVVCLIGGYVCGTMARRSGVLEGFAVWLWAAVAAVVASLIVELSSTTYAVLYQFDLFPRIEVGSFDGRNGAIITAIILAAAGLIGALIGGSIGAAAHRRVHVVEATSWSR